MARTAPRYLLLAAAMATILASAPAQGEGGVPTIAPSADDARPAYRRLPSTKQPDFRLPTLPKITAPGPEGPVLPPLPRLPTTGGADCAPVFAPACGRVGNTVQTYSNSCRLRAAGAVPVPDSACR